MEYTAEKITDIIVEANAAAHKAATEYLNTHYQGDDVGACGFAWVNIWGIKGNTKLGRQMKKVFGGKEYNGAYQMWNPSGLGVQNIDVKEAGAKAAAEVLKAYGFKAYAGSRLD